MELKKYRFIIVNVLIILILVSSIYTVAADNFNLDDTKTIELNKFLAIPIRNVDGRLYSGDIFDVGDMVDVDIQVVRGGSVDVFLMNAEDYASYLQRDEFHFYVVGSAQDVKSKMYSYAFVFAGDYYLVVDNDGRIGSTKAIGPVDVHYKISVYTPTPEPTPIAAPAKTPGFGLFIAVIAFCFAIVLRGR